MANFLANIFGSRNQRLLRQFSTTVQSINHLEESMIALNDDQLANKTIEFKKRFDSGESLESLLIEVNDNFIKQASDVKKYLKKAGFKLKHKRNSEIIAKSTKFSSFYNQIWTR